MQYQSISEACESLLVLMNQARRDVPNAVEDVMDSAKDRLLVMLEALEDTWDIRAAD